MSFFKIPIFKQIPVLVSQGQKISKGDILAKGRVSTKKIEIEIFKKIRLKPSELAACLCKKAGDEVSAGEELVKKCGGFLRKDKKILSPREGFIEEINLDQGKIILGILPYDYELESPGEGKIVKIDPGELEIDFEGEEITGFTAYGTTAFGEIIVLFSYNQEVDFGKIDYLLKDKMLIGGVWNKISVAKACAVGASGVIGGKFLFSLKEENEFLLRPLDYEGNAGFAIAEISNEEDFQKIFDWAGKNLIISPSDLKLCLL